MVGYAQICADVPHRDCRICAHDPVPLAEKFVARAYCSIEERVARYASLDSGQRETAQLVLFDKSDTARFVLVWHPRAGDADDILIPFDTGVIALSIPFHPDLSDLSITAEQMAIANYTYEQTWGFNAALVSTNDPHVPYLVIFEVWERCSRMALQCVQRRPDPPDRVRR